MPCCTAQVGKKIYQRRSKDTGFSSSSCLKSLWKYFKAVKGSRCLCCCQHIHDCGCAAEVGNSSTERERVQLPLVSAVLPCKMITVGLQTYCCSSLCDHGNHKDHTEENYAVFWIIFEQIYLPTKIVWEQHKVWSLISQAGPVNSVVTTSLNHNQHTKTLHFHKQLFHQAVVHLPSCNLHGLQVKSTQKWQNLQW